MGKSINKILTSKIYLLAEQQHLDRSPHTHTPLPRTFHQNCISPAKTLKGIKKVK